MVLSYMFIRLDISLSSYRPLLPLACRKFPTFSPYEETRFNLVTHWYWGSQKNMGEMGGGAGWLGGVEGWGRQNAI